MKGPSGFVFGRVRTRTVLLGRESRRRRNGGLFEGARVGSRRGGRPWGARNGAGWGRNRARRTQSFRGRLLAELDQCGEGRAQPRRGSCLRRCLGGGRACCALWGAADARRGCLLRAAGARRSCLRLRGRLRIPLRGARGRTAGGRESGRLGGQLARICHEPNRTALGHEWALAWRPGAVMPFGPCQGNGHYALHYSAGAPQAKDTLRECRARRRHIVDEQDGDVR